MGKIIDIRAREILDSRGNPTVEAEVQLANQIIGRASVPSGASTGMNEALELRDKDMNRFMGKGVLTAINNIEQKIKPVLLGQESTEQAYIDDLMIKLDGTNNKSNLGANSILAVSMANLKASAIEKGVALYEYIGPGRTMPIAMMNIINGGMHAGNNLDFQEFMIIPTAPTFKERVRMGSEIFHHLKDILASKGYSTSVGDEGGFAPNLTSNVEALDLIMEAIQMAHYVPGKDVNIALDIAASSFYNKKQHKYILSSEGKDYTTGELIDFYNTLIDKYPIISIEDPLDENDWDGFTIMTSKLGHKIQIIGDDLFVTNPILLQKGIDLKACNAILIKVNQIGSITETLNTIKLAKANGYKTIISHRSGETEDTTIADLAVATDAGQIKSGSLSRTDRVSKYNQLIRIEEAVDLNSSLIKYLT